MIINNKDEVIGRIVARLNELEGSKSYDRLMTRLTALTRYGNEAMDYPVPENVDFPDVVPLAYAVCHPECGKREFIVDGSTQLCDRCGSTMFRTEVATYRIESTCPSSTK